MAEDLWNTSIESEGSGGGDFPVAAPGTYYFDTKHCVGKNYVPKPTSKIGKCAEIDLQLSFEAKDKNGKDVTVNVFDRLYSDPSTQWKMAAFAKCIGIYHKGITPKEILEALYTTRTGEAEIDVETYNGKERNVIKKYIPDNGGGDVKPSKPAKAAEPAKPIVDANDLPF